MKEEHPTYGFSYGILTGTYVGEIMIYFKSDEIDHHFLSIPKNINRKVPIDKFDLGLQGGIVDPIRQIDTEYIEILERQFEYNEENTK